MLSHPRLFKNWNDLNIVVKVAAHQSFSAAARDLGADQTTLSRRISDLEFRLGRPLFLRKTSGVVPTETCLGILAEALSVGEAMHRIEERLKGAADTQVRVTICAPPGVLAYTLRPALRSDTALPQPLCMDALRRYSLPSLKFTSDPVGADISVLAMAEKELPGISGSYRIKRLGSIVLRPYGSQALMRNGGASIGRFDDLRSVALLDMKLYRSFSSLDSWNAILDGHEHSELFETTRGLHAAFLQREAVSIVPIYSHLYEHRARPLEFACPRMALSLWLSVHEDNLKEPPVRNVFHALSEAFERSPWFQ